MKQLKGRNILLLLIVLLFEINLYADAPSRNTGVDIGLYKSECAGFEVKIRSNETISSFLTNIQFTIKWPENTVLLDNFNSDYGLEQQGPVYTNDGYHYAVFVSVPSGPVTADWTAGVEYVVMTFEHDQSGSGNIDFLIAQDEWTAQNNGLYYMELLGEDFTGSVYHQAGGVFAGSCMNIGLYNVSCGKFRVDLKPGADVESYITNIQFTIKWPENSVELINFDSGYEIEQQGPVYISDGFNYAVFVAAPVSSGAINWNSGEENTVLTFEHDQSGTDSIDVVIANDAWTAGNNGEFYLELYGSDATGYIYHNALSTYSGECSVAYIKVLLQGAYDQSLGKMRNDYSVSGDIPPEQPYDTLPWQYIGSETLSAIPDSIVDWIIVELRDKNDATLLKSRRAAILSENGIVLETDCSEGLRFGAAHDDYYLVVKHRNHIPVMSGLPVSLPNGSAAYDFTEIINTQPYLHNDPLPAVIELPPAGSGKYGIIAGDVNADGILRYIGTDNDRGPILSLIAAVSGSSFINETINGYYPEDVNLNNVVQYNLSGNDRAIILNNLWRLTGSAIINKTYQSVVPDFTTLP